MLRTVSNQVLYISKADKKYSQRLLYKVGTRKKVLLASIFSLLQGKKRYLPSDIFFSHDLLRS